MDPEVFDNVESAYEALGHGPSSSIGNLRNKQMKSFAAQVDFPDGCNLLVYQCVKQLRNALAAKDEEIKHLRLLVHHLRFTHFCNLLTKVLKNRKRVTTYLKSGSKSWSVDLIKSYDCIKEFNRKGHERLGPHFS